VSEPIVVDLGADDDRSGADIWRDWAKSAEWKFSSYYKFTFTFTASGERLVYPVSDQAERAPFAATATAGGDSADIYRWHVADPMTWAEICEGGEVDFTIRSEGGVLFSTNPYFMSKREENGASAT